MFTPSEKCLIAKTLNKKKCNLLKLCIQCPCARLILHFPPLCSHHAAARTAAPRTGGIINQRTLF